MGVKYYCDFCQDEVISSRSFTPLELGKEDEFGRRTTSGALSPLKYDLCIDCARAVNEALERIKKYRRGEPLDEADQLVQE